MGERGRTIQEMGALAGVSARTLRLWDEKGLLVPKCGENGYRVYTEEDERRLQQILLWRACGMPLGEIKRALASPEFDEEKALEEQIALLEEREEVLRRARECAERTLGAVRKGKKMKSEERFRGLKEAAIEKNEKLYGAEAREKYGNEAVDAANDAVRNMTEGEWQDLGALEERIIEELKSAMKRGSVSGPEAKQLVRDHAAWVQAHWGKDHPLTHEMHVGLGQMYVADPRFTEYYDTRAGEGAAAFLAAAIEASAF
ncbi:MAG: MerR family transcriptional regulator [Atopobiaceae bacterium]